mgnify:CR=1 FL=1
MKIKTEIENLTEADIYSLTLFALYKAESIPELSSLSQLAYILDKENLLKLCEYYGGLTIRIPTISEIETFIHALLVFQLRDIEKKPEDYIQAELSKINVNTDIVEERYFQVKELLKDYNFVSGRK